MHSLIFKTILTLFVAALVSCGTQSQTTQAPEAESAPLATQPAPSPANPPATEFVSMTTADFSNMLSNLTKPQLIDVRTPPELAGGYIPGARNFNVNGPDFETQMASLDPDYPVLVYCGAGGRSKRAAKALLSMGFKEVYELDGGFTDWKAKGMEIEVK
ncbi:MAG: rhodanese-like domain-containing protein [Bacteroidota bacterium]